MGVLEVLEPPRPPASLEIVGLQYGVHFAPPRARELRNALGMIYPEAQAIYVSTGQAEQGQRETLLHETIHSLEEAGDLELTERQVRGLSRLLFAVGNQNREAVRWIFGIGSEDRK